MVAPSCHTSAGEEEEICRALGLTGSLPNPLSSSRPVTAALPANTLNGTCGMTMVVPSGLTHVCEHICLNLHTQQNKTHNQRTGGTVKRWLRFAAGCRYVTYAHHTMVHLYCQVDRIKGCLGPWSSALCACDDISRPLT